MLKKLVYYFYGSLSIIIICCSKPQLFDSYHKALSVNFTGSNAQIEIGGPFVGIEMHHSSPLLNRISFFYPVANSIDLSTDYWKRDQFRIMYLGLKVGEKPKHWIGIEPFEFELTPYSIVFHKRDDEKNIEIKYEFCKTKPAMVAQITLTNISAEQQSFEIYTHLETSLRTCHTYTLKDKAWTEYAAERSTIYTNFNDAETGNTQIFVANVGESPISFTTDSENAGFPASGENWWMNKSSHLPQEIITKSNPRRPLTAFVYRKKLTPHQKMTIIQLIGSNQIGEGEEIVAYLAKKYRQEIDLFKQTVLQQAFVDHRIVTGDSSIDHSVQWAKAILATNAHYLNGKIVPMPCPAEYNFYFTHDVLLTDLAVVNFNIARVKKDLEYIINHANSDWIIPHAYYWKDDHYITEYAGSDNWNHFWFILLSGKYLRHSKDIKMLERLYPFILTSINQTLTNKKDDDLMWANCPDWWDIGSSYGPRAYMTILVIRALREFVFISTVLGKHISELTYYEELAYSIQQQLNEKLWDNNLNYLINYYKDGKKDKHIYIGSLLAAHFNLIDRDKKMALVQTATNTLLDEKLGIYNVFPMDFHLLIDYLKFNDNEAGEPFFYANGGIWPHGNAWYALALISSGQKEEAYHFVKNIMTIDGIINSPNGQPAMYEYRNSNFQNPLLYGKVDKPQFLWAGGWYLYCLYDLLGVRENEWNIVLEPYLSENIRKSHFSIYYTGKSVTVEVSGNGKYIHGIKYDGKRAFSAVLPMKSSIKEIIEIELGNPEFPYLASSNSLLITSDFDEHRKILIADLKAFPKHDNQAIIVSPWKPESVFLNDIKLNKDWIIKKKDNIYLIEINFFHSSVEDTLKLQF